MERKQFTFYESFRKATLRIKKGADRAAAYDAIADYALYGVEPDLDKLPDQAALAFELIRPTLDASRRKANSGKTGGERKQTASKTEANRKQSGREKEGEKEKENECYYPPNPLSEVMTAYMDRVNPTPSQTSMEELKGYVEQMGGAVCLRAIDIALDAKKANWNYIRAILRDKQSKGVKCLADWDKLEETREKEAEQSGNTAQRAKPAGLPWLN